MLDGVVVMRICMHCWSRLHFFGPHLQRLPVLSPNWLFSSYYFIIQDRCFVHYFASGVIDFFYESCVIDLSFIVVHESTSVDLFYKEKNENSSQRLVAHEQSVRTSQIQGGGLRLGRRCARGRRQRSNIEEVDIATGVGDRLWSCTREEEAMWWNLDGRLH
jgi:hypothetical protein